MTLKVAVLIACFVAATVALPANNVDVDGKNIYINSEYALSGSNGTFRYPTSGFEYQRNERVLITAGFPEDTVFILESYNTEYIYDTITIHKWVLDRLVVDKIYSGISTHAEYFWPEGNFLITFASDWSVVSAGFSLRWAPSGSLLLQ